MERRCARMGDLPQLKELFQAVIVQMEQERISIWDEVYPVVCFPGDIQNRRLYVLTEGECILAAFALCPWSAEYSRLGWTEPEAEACVLERLAVRADRRGEGLGAAALQYAADAAEAEGARYLRLLVVDFNRPAAALYRKCGFRRVEGIYHNVVDRDLTLLEYGFEKRL